MLRLAGILRAIFLSSALICFKNIMLDVELKPQRKQVYILFFMARASASFSFQAFLYFNFRTSSRARARQERKGRRGDGRTAKQKRGEG